MLVQVVNILQYGLLTRDTDVVDGREMLCVLRKANTTTVGNDGDVELIMISRAFGEGCV